MRKKIIGGHRAFFFTYAAKYTVFKQISYAGVAIATEHWSSKLP